MPGPTAGIEEEKQRNENLGWSQRFARAESLTVQSTSCDKALGEQAERTASQAAGQLDPSCSARRWRGWELGGLHATTTQRTNVIKAVPELENFPPFAYNAKSFDSLQSRIGDNIILSDVVGLVTRLTDIIP